MPMPTGIIRTDDAVISVFLVDDHALIRRGLRSFLELFPDILVSGEASDGREAVDAIRAMVHDGDGPDVVLMDLVMPALDGVGAALELRGLAGGPQLVMLSSFGEVRHLRAALQAGVAGYLLKDASPEFVVEAIRNAHRGQLHLDVALSTKLAEAMAVPTMGPDLTSREKEVLTLVARGMSNDDIASNLHISERTARTHVSHLLGKLGFESRIQLALWALDQEPSRPTMRR